VTGSTITIRIAKIRISTTIIASWTTDSIIATWTINAGKTHSIIEQREIINQRAIITFTVNQTAITIISTYQTTILIASTNQAPITVINF
jgi:hypothetical protein